MTYTIATANMKGGVGKTTLSVNLATALAKEHGKRVLIFDLDTQISATLSLMAPTEFANYRKRKRTLKNFINQIIQPNSQARLPVQDAIHRSVCNINNLDLLPGDIELYDEYMVAEMLHEKAFEVDRLDFEVVWNRFERTLLKQILQPIISDYDCIIFDCAPGYNLMTRSALAASDFYILPAKPEPLSIVGIQLLERRIAELKKSHEVEAAMGIQLIGIVFTMAGNLFTGRYQRQVVQRINQDFTSDKIFNTQIPMDVNVAKAVDSFMPVVLSNPHSAGAKAFSQLTQEFVQKLNVAQEQKTQPMNPSFATI
ncbi:cobyrinic acid a,c-diamide synthase [Chroococcidiopsis sp. CCALA 051]|uniref:ParA family protein n=1 Tax=Chroococcidiopsis sp. CCALA 051 TaxID=869949 RepID=UPI000D0CF301|nr:cobyrinic acid a,c-diamide synthase [Chroococcidiopsis sp. CCALA 051]